MTTTSNISRTTIGLMVKGLFILLPIFVVGLAVAKIFQIVHAAVGSAMERFPEVFFHIPAARVTMGVASMLALFTAVGLLGQLRLGRALGRRIEEVVLYRVPFYPLLRRLASGLAGEEREDALKPVLVAVNPGVSQLGFLVERHDNGLCTVFLPGSPNTSSGSVVIVEPALVTEVPTAGHKVVSSLHRWGSGSRYLGANAGPAAAGRMLQPEGVTTPRRQAAQQTFKQAAKAEGDIPG